MDNKSYNVRVPKRWARIAMIVGVTALIVAPLTAVATDAFNDVPNSHTFHEDIAWMKTADVTRGCNPPANDRYCPEEDVTRGQMSAFMRRLAQYMGAEDGTPAQADHATTADDATNAVNAINAVNADNATTVDDRVVGCASGETEYAGECWESDARATVSDVFAASETCGTEGGRLPEALELRRFGQISTIAAPSAEYSENVYHNGVTFRVFRVTGNALVDSSTLDDGTFRCVFPLVESAATPASASSQGNYAEDGS